MSVCASRETSVCTYLGTMGCDVPSDDDVVSKMDALSHRVLHGRATAEERLEYSNLADQGGKILLVRDSLYGASCFCPVELRGKL